MHEAEAGMTQGKFVKRRAVSRFLHFAFTVITSQYGDPGNKERE